MLRQNQEKNFFSVLYTDKKTGVWKYFQTPLKKLK